MKHLTDAPQGAFAGVQFVLCDIDDTLTSGGKLSCEAYCALWQLHDAGLHVIPITGRPAGWCDMIVRQWPVDAVIGENGALVFHLVDEKLASFFHPSVDRNDLERRFAELERRVFAAVPGTRRAKDQFSRMFDLAIDFREEPPYLSYDDAERIRDVCEEAGAHAKVSSIHVNTWFGDYDKVGMAKLYLSEAYGLNLDSPADNRKVAFCGDSPNDEPMFSFFERTCGVANFEPFLSTIVNKPAFVASKSHGAGFVEFATKVLADNAPRVS